MVTLDTMLDEMSEEQSLAGWSLPSQRERSREFQPIDVPLHARVVRFLRWSFARPKLDSRGRRIRP